MRRERRVVYAGARRSALPAQFALSSIDLGREVADVRVECGEHASDGAPVRASLPALKTPDECGIDFEPFSQLLLRDSRLLAERAQGATKNQLVLFGRHFEVPLHSENPHVARVAAPGYLMADSRLVSTSKIKCPRAALTAGGVAPRVRAPGARVTLPMQAWLSSPTVSRGLQPQGGTEMSSKLTIPAELVRTLRIGLHSELGEAASEIDQITYQPGREEYPEWYEEPLTQLDGARALLDVIGWGETQQPVAVEIDLAEHYAALFGALRGQVLIHQDMIEEAEQVDADRAEQGKPPKAEATIARAAALDRLLASSRGTGGSAWNRHVPAR